MLMLMPSALASFKSWSGFGLRIPYSYFFIVAEFMPDKGVSHCNQILGIKTEIQ